MNTLNPYPDPVADRAIERRLEQYAASRTPHAAAGPLATELDRYDIATVLEVAYEWGGQRYASATDAIAAAKRSAT